MRTFIIIFGLLVSVRFTNREVWLKHRDKEVWRGPFHWEQQGSESKNVYATQYLATIPDPR